MKAQLFTYFLIDGKSGEPMTRTNVFSANAADGEAYNVSRFFDYLGSVENIRVSHYAAMTWRENNQADGLHVVTGKRSLQEVDVCFRFAECEVAEPEGDGTARYGHSAPGADVGDDDEPGWRAEEDAEGRERVEIVLPRGFRHMSRGERFRFFKEMWEGCTL